MMKGMSRRKLFQTAAAAPVAMQLSGGVTENNPGIPTGPYPYISGYAGAKAENAGAPIDQAGYLRERVKNLRAAIDQPPSEQDLIEQHYSTHHLIVENYNALLSLSSARRQQMIHHAGYELSRKRMRELQSLELRNVLKQLSGL